VNLTAIVSTVLARPGPVRLVAIDGPGGAGKSTFAAVLAEAFDGAPVVPTDDFASADNPIDWWPRLLEQVIAPLSRREAVRYRRYDWASESLAEWRIVPPAPVVIIEGVTAGRAEWKDHLAYVIWLDTQRDVRLARGLARDGTGALDAWHGWMTAEDDHYRRDPTRERADVIISGTTPFTNRDQPE
jgi:uridine kinase